MKTPTPKVSMVSESEGARLVEKCIRILDFPERIRIATGVLLDHAQIEGDFGMVVETGNNGKFRVIVEKEEA